MLRTKAKLFKILVPVYILFIVSVLFVYTGCGQRAEDDAATEMDKDFSEEHGDKDANGRFEGAIDELIKVRNERDRTAFFRNMAMTIINTEYQSLDTNPKSEKNALCIVLEAMEKVPAPAGIIVEKGLKMEKYIEILEALHNKGATLDSKILEKFCNRALNAKYELQGLYYPLLRLGGLKPDTRVLYKETQGAHIQVPLIDWAILHGNLDKDVRKKIITILTDPATKRASEVNAELHEAEGKKMTPAMFAARLAEQAKNDEDAKYVIEIFELFLQDTSIKFMDREKEAKLKQPDILKDQPLLSFIIYNCLNKHTRLREEWIKILKRALDLGDLKPSKEEKEKKKMNEEMTKYMKDYVEKNTSGADQRFDDEGLYDKDNLNEVKRILADYLSKLS